MSLSTVETKLAKYHVLHLVIGLILGAILLAIPKVASVSVAVFVIAMLLPSALIPTDFTGSKWIDRALTLAGAILVFAVFHFLRKI